MAWRSPLWVRWVSWTALYALVYRGGVTVAESTTWGWVVSLLIPMVVAFIIGIRFRSRWWTLGPLVAVTLVFATNLAADDALAWLVIFLVPILVYAGVFSFAAFVGVQVGQAMHEHEAGPRRLGPGNGAPTPVPRNEGASG